jgi:hypothetical protein
MRFILLFLLFNYGVFAQTLLKYDNIEAYDWTGVWWNPNPGGYYTNASVSGTTSAAILGAGNGTSIIEQNWYSMPNITGLNSAYTYEFRFRLASYTFSSPSATTRGVDAADYIDVQVSRNAGTSYVSELRITGNNNATWQYQTTGVINHVANGVFSSVTDVYQSAVGNNNGLSTGYSVIKLSISGINQIAVDILARVNSAGEEWWIDNVELWQMTVPLPVENNWYVSNVVDGSGDSESPSEYSCIDFDTSSIVYYKLFQNDFNGNYRFLAVLSLHRDINQKKIIKMYDMLGREVGDDYVGIVIVLYSNGHIEKIYK